MEAVKKRKIKRIVFAAVLVLLVAGLALLPLVMEARQKGVNSSASILSAQAETGSISRTISGTGTLTEQKALEVTVPEGVKVTRYLVSNGILVSEGDPVAEVDRVSVMEAASALRESMDQVAEAMEEARSGANASYVTAPAAGRVKAVYAKAGDSVQQVILEHGALAILSLDGLMAVDVPTDALIVGQMVTVVLSDGREAAGRVSTVRDGIAAVTLSDYYGSIGEAVTVKDEQGAAVGGGELYVHSAWKAMAAGGVVSNVFASEGIGFYSGGALFSITDSLDSEEFVQQALLHRDYEEIMSRLFRMYQDGVLKAPCDGYVTGVDEDILDTLADDGSGVQAVALANEPGAVPVSNRVGMVTAMDPSGVTVLFQAWDSPQIADYSDLSGVVTAASSMTVETKLASLPVAYAWDGSDWAGAGVSLGDIFVFAYSDAGPIWMVLAGHDTVPATGPSGSSGSFPSGGGSGGFSGMPSMGGMSGLTGLTGSGESENALFSTEETVLLSVTPIETATVTITVDELDVLSVHDGQEALITLDALPGQSFSGVISHVDTAASNDGGNSKYSAKVELKRTGNMLGSMNASVTVTVETREGVVLIPSAALIEANGQSMVYTGYDAKTQMLLNPVPVELGLSDGQNVEILSGLQPGALVWYAYYDQLPNS